MDAVPEIAERVPRRDDGLHIAAVVGGTCQHSAISGCCNADADCSDASSCTTDRCDTTSHTCSHTAITGCCSSDADCSTGSACNTDTCDTATGTWRDVERLESTRRRDPAIITDSPEQHTCCPMPKTSYISKYGETVHTRVNCEGLRRATSEISQKRWCKLCEPRAA